jgi:hypothetical protein
MKRIGMVLVGVSLALAAAGPAVAGRSARCLLEVDGDVYLDGACRFESLGGAGSVCIGCERGSRYFAYVNMNGDGTAEAFWNADPASTRAQTSLGTVKRDGACWLNATAKICAR